MAGESRDRAALVRWQHRHGRPASCLGRLIVRPGLDRPVIVLSELAANPDSSQISPAPSRQPSRPWIQRWTRNPSCGWRTTEPSPRLTWPAHRRPSPPFRFVLTALTAAT